MTTPSRPDTGFAFAKEQFQQIVEDTLKLARQLGASDAGAEVSEGVGLSVSVRKGELENVERNRDKSLGVSVYLGQRRGNASTSDFSPAALKQTVSNQWVATDSIELLIEQQSGDPMNDLEYRRKQLLKLQEAVIDLEDLSSGVSITDLTLTDMRIDLAQYSKAHPDKLASLALGACAITTSLDADIPPGMIFCLRAEGEAARKAAEPGYPLAPHYLVHVGEDGAVCLPYTQTKRILDRLKRLALGRELPDPLAASRFDKATKHGEDMRHAQKLLAAAVGAVVGKHEERAAASLFAPGGTHAMKGEFAGSNDFEVIAFMVILADQDA